MILGSSSPRRRDLLAQIGIIPDAIVSPEIDETPLRDEAPRALAARLARAKLAAVAHEGAFIIAADTVLGLGSRVLPKAETEAEARACLTRLAGRRHKVYSAVAIRAPDGRVVSRTVATVVSFARIEPAAIEDYLASGEWQGKAGGYAIQGRAAGFVDFLSGSYSGVVGLPLHETLNLLRGLGWRAA
ncbi:MAG: septum formation protein Maf [Acidiphilium sp. 37-64-53]|nr:MAG: septum formation protein Maf [Acidiphilium sp. 37-64-53]OZB25672.1 MAG: septum formation protein Maf [Acidiphilium sp. 34-64-41]